MSERSVSSVMVMADVFPIEEDEPCPLPSAPKESIRRFGKPLTIDTASVLDSAVDVSDNFSRADKVIVDGGRR